MVGLARAGIVCIYAGRFHQSLGCEMGGLGLHRTGIVLLVMLAVLGVTIVRIGQLIWLHLFLGCSCSARWC